MDSNDELSLGPDRGATTPTAGLPMCTVLQLIEAGYRRVHLSKAAQIRGIRADIKRALMGKVGGDLVDVRGRPLGGRG